MPHPKNGNKKRTCVCWGRMRTCALKYAQEGVRTGARVPSRDSSQPRLLPLPPPPCPGLGRLFLGDTKLEMPHENPHRSPLAFFPGERVHRRGQKSTFKVAKRSPSRVLCSPHNYVRCVIVSITPGDQRPCPGRLVGHPEMQTLINSASHPPRRAALRGQRISGCFSRA